MIFFLRIQSAVAVDHSQRDTHAYRFTKPPVSRSYTKSASVLALAANRYAFLKAFAIEHVSVGHSWEIGKHARIVHSIHYGTVGVPGALFDRMREHLQHGLSQEMVPLPDGRGEQDRWFSYASRVGRGGIGWELYWAVGAGYGGGIDGTVKLGDWEKVRRATIECGASMDTAPHPVWILRVLGVPAVSRDGFTTVRNTSNDPSQRDFLYVL
jgi:hypothetical protein